MLHLSRPVRFSRLLLFLWLPLLFLGCTSDEVEAPPRKRSVVLVTIDTLRADHLGSYGYPRPVSPFLDRLAAEGLRFENVISPSSHTAPAHASIFTSLQPFQHRVVKNGQHLGKDFHTLAEFFGEQGYETAGMASVGFLVELRQGFETFHAEWRTGDLTIGQALEWLHGRPDPSRPFFLWVHVYDPHRLKGPRHKLQPDVEALRAKTPEEADRFVKFLEEERAIDPLIYGSIEALLARYDTYDAGIRFVDRHLERLHQATLEADSDTLWVVTSDHGEGLGNHGYDDHGRYLYREQLRVPLILAGSGIEPAVSDRLVRSVDIFPTLVDWVGGPEPMMPIQGYSLFEDAPAPGSLSPRLAFAQRRPKDGARHRRKWEDGEVHSLQTRRYKYIRSSEGEDQFFDLELDPWEQVNRIGEDSEIKDRLRQGLEEYFDPDGAPQLTDEATVHDSELRALGYL